MKKLVLASAAFVMAFGMSAIVMADTVIPGQYTPRDQSVMGVGKTIMEMGARDRALTNAVNRASRAHRSGGDAFGDVNASYQFGASQSDQSWKAARTVEEAQVRGLVAGDCQGDNSTDAYRKQMGQSRDGFMEEKLVSNAQCGEYHPTLK